MLAELAEFEQIRGEHGMGVAADGVFGNAERRAEHARLGREFIRVRPAIQCEHEEAVGAQLGADRDQGVEVRHDRIQDSRIRDGIISRVLPLRAMRAGMTSCN